MYTYTSSCMYACMCLSIYPCVYIYTHKLCTEFVSHVNIMNKKDNLKYSLLLHHCNGVTCEKSCAREQESERMRRRGALSPSCSLCLSLSCTKGFWSKKKHEKQSLHFKSRDFSSWNNPQMGSIYLMKLLDFWIYFNITWNSTRIHLRKFDPWKLVRFATSKNSVDTGADVLHQQHTAMLQTFKWAQQLWMNHKWVPEWVTWMCHVCMSHEWDISNESHEWIMPK